MEDDTWSFGFSTSARRKYRSDVCFDFEEIEGDDDLKMEYRCPFCAEVFDLGGFCCHIFVEHPTEAKSGVSTSVKELQNDHFHSLVSRSSSLVPPSKMALDPLLSFIYNVPIANASESVVLVSSTKVSAEDKVSIKKTLERDDHISPLSNKDHLEKAMRCEFVQGLLSSTFIDDGL
ncbi:Di19 domain-containing protein [Cephalotus follicularis]|uniref:Di19 domain-containing protein n=1 Tax=Cephalotus follicularis TaxID=3775 RepID=A0A1Q3AN63_CEPFO|nr:Di19 domain-containing protein [Cephalotus follicularis]